MSSSKKTTRLPLYVQISELLHREIAAGHWVAGERLPTESQLAQDLDVAVGTLRKALAVLENDGLLERRHGSGTYVQKPPEGGAVYQFFRLELLKGGGMPRAVTQSVELITDSNITPKFEQKINEKKSKNYWRIRRLRYLNQTAVAAEEIWFDERHTKTLSAEEMHESLYVHYREEFDFWMTHVTDSVSCQESPDWACNLLNKPKKSILGWIERQGWANNGLIEEYSQTWFDPELSRYISRLS